MKAVTVQSGVKLEENGASGVGFTDVEVAEDLPDGAAVELNGIFENVNVEAKSFELQLQKGSISKLGVAAGAAGLKVKLSAGTTVVQLVLNAAASITGAGLVQAVTVNDGAKGSSFTEKPATVDGSQKDSISIGGPIGLP
ncbi:hypothetical protein [Paenibacillus sp. BAC0078]